jgi:MarR family transcriptional regulator for hemolysin
MIFKFWTDPLGGRRWDPMATPGLYISRIARGLARVGDAQLRDLGFATAQLPVLTALKEGARLSQKELAQWAKVEQPTMAQLLSRWSVTT